MEQMIAGNSLQNWDREPDQVNSTCLSTPVILRQIFQCISTKELIKLSLVNKLWNHEARRLMRNRGNLTASINKSHTCHDLRAFVSDLRRMKQMTKVIPFSGMTITVGGWKCANKDYCQQSPNRDLEPVYEEIFGSLTWKHLTIIHLVGWEEHKSCPGFILQKKLLRKLDAVLEEFSVQLEENEAKSFEEDFLRDCYFSRLKTFGILNDVALNPEWSDFIKTVVSLAPNLQTLYTKESVRFEAKDSDNESHGVNSACLSTPVILREIFQCFATTELIQLSLVNKQWNYEARSLMRNRGNLIASINKNQACQDLRAFASDLRRMKQVKKVVPFSGMTITVGGWKCATKDYCQQSPNRDLEPVYDEILGSLTWKHLTIIHFVCWEEHKFCPGFILQKKLLRKLDSVLEELTIQLEYDATNYFKEVFLRDCYFPRLKTFRFLNEVFPVQPDFSDLIKHVISIAPNLEIFYTAECVDLEANLLEGSSAVHVAGSSYSPAFDRIPETIASKIRMQGMHFLKFRSPFSLERFNRITAMLLQSSRTELRSMQINIIFLAPLMNYGICLENVREVELSWDFLHVEETQPPFTRIAKSFDFTRVFPNLNTVSICHFSHRIRCHVPAEFSEMIDQVNATLQPPPLDRAVNIKHLKLNNVPSRSLGQRSPFQLLGQMFPHVQKLSIETGLNPFAHVRDVWVDLTEVDVTLKFYVGDLANLDSVFCGIFPEEVALLREQDEEYLRRVNIVPVMPSVAYLKELRSIYVYCEVWEDEYEYTGPIDDPTCLFSKVTPLVAFQRRPNLTVKLTSEDERLAEALGHLRPYASVVFKKMKGFV